MLYSLEGNYFFHGKDNQYTGVFAIGDNRIRGFISDQNSFIPKHNVEGKVIDSNGVPILEFLKKPIGNKLVQSLMANIFYRVEKTDGIRDIEGKYEGFWTFGDAKILRLGTFTEETEKENRTSLTLRQKINNDKFLNLDK